MSIAGVQRFLVLVDVLDDSGLINHKRGSIRDGELRIQYPIRFRYFAGEITEERKLHANLLGIGFVGELAVDADT